VKRREFITLLGGALSVLLCVSAAAPRRSGLGPAAISPSRRPCVRPRRLYAAHRRCDQRGQCDTLRQAQFQFYPRYRAGRRHNSRTSHHGGTSIGSGQNGSRVHRLCQGQSGQDQYTDGRLLFLARNTRRAERVGFAALPAEGATGPSLTQETCVCASIHPQLSRTVS
jgi:hypothetical protein